jgi:hypothetical protein
MALKFGEKKKAGWTVPQRTEFFDVIENMIVAFYNIGVSQDAMGRRTEAITAL